MFRLFIYISCCLLWMSCEKPTNLELNNSEQRLVVQSNFSPNQPVEVFVSRSESLSISDDDFVAIGNAIVEIYQETTLLEKLEFISAPLPDGLFYRSTEFRPRVGIEYMIRVNAPGFKEVRAVNKIPSPVSLTKLEVGQIVEEVLDVEGRSYTFSINIEFLDPPNEENFYHLVFLQQKIITVGELVEEPLIVEINSNTNSFKPYYRGGILISDEGHDGQINKHEVKFRGFLQNENESIGKLFVELRTVSKDYFSYHSSLNNKNDSSGVPLDEPVVTFNNIDQGYGIFAGYSTSADSLAVVQ